MAKEEGVSIPTHAIVLSNVDATHSEKALKVTPTKLEGSSTMLISHNFCDKTTWYTESVRVSSEVIAATVDSDNKIFDALHDFWIDVTHGKIPYEHRLEGYDVIVSVDDVPLTGEASLGFTVNYEEGLVTFNESQIGIVKAEYSYAEGSGWYIGPMTGKIIKMIGTDVKFTTDAVLDKEHAISFQLYIMGGAMAYGSPTVYNTMYDVITCSKGNATTIPAFGELTKEVIVLPFDYITSKDLPSSLGAMIKIKLASNDPITGTSGLVVAHCISMDE